MVQYGRKAAVRVADQLAVTGRLAVVVERAARAGRLDLVARWLHDLPGAFLKAGDHAILAGVWAPRTARRYAQAVSTTGRLVVLEANPENAGRLRSELKDLPQVKVIAKALWQDDQGVEFLHAPEGEYQGFNRVEASESPRSDTPLKKALRQTVPSLGLDDLGDEVSFSKLAHMSLTINGSEVEALEGSHRCLTESPRLSVACWTEFPGYGPRVESALTKAGFDVATTTGRGAELRWTDLDLRYVLGFRGSTTGQ